MAGVKKGKGGSKSKGNKGKESKGNVKRTASSHQVWHPCFQSLELVWQTQAWLSVPPS